MISLFYSRRYVVKFVFFFLYSSVLCSSLCATPDIQNRFIRNTIDHFLSIKTIHGDFIQKDELGNIVRGEFFMARPGQLYFKYSSPSSIHVISDGSNIAIYNPKLDTWSVYPIINTLFGVVFSDKRSELEDSIHSIEINDKFITILFKNNYKKNVISMTFSRASYRLINWNIIDNFGRSTLVEILKYKENIALKSELFVIPYDKIHNIG
ncbi:MAG: outer membrane lipoprotein carrier protein LolA [Candidatus Liberibacter europaeus]|uniref:Outer membrane lipoprotein carrier protein LolA n=1 Tax=Candidatus Liberibacter europaeus TaxID=744859 RepID=A0A2T4VZ86_9HYPH|nr:outer membrane lipoprotein carrier protein LolA [Candidatus Liberibacter europaeus]PTL87094.1 MAG: outer membrane lipoprotein carrier protein LolA [Candidatus Liberibacter europaeus]